MEIPLHIAAREGDTEMMEFLLAKDDIKVNEANNKERYPSTCCCTSR